MADKEIKKMKLSKLFTKTRKDSPEDATAASHDLLVRAGFINQEMAGVYSLLPMGFKVLKRIENVIREEMDAVGGQEVIMPSLQPKANWIKTGRWETVDVLYKVKSRWSDSEYALGPTHEEIVFPLVGKFLSSYKDLPVSVYQIQTKFRDEKRAKSGIIRGREFGMKDMYSFHETQEDLTSHYEEVKEAYLKIFKRCGIDAKVTKASGGDFTDKYSHEFMAVSEAGEDTIIACTSCHHAENVEVSELKAGDPCPQCQSSTESCKAIEIGNIFDLAQKFGEDFGLQYTDENGERKYPFSGCYGIGTTRLIGSIVESSHDEKGIIWPEEVSPFDVHLIGLNLKNNDAKRAAEEAYEAISSSGATVLYDDREEASAGIKFNDADLIGIPQQMVVSEKLAAEGKIEIRSRRNGESETADLSTLDKILKS